MRCWQATVGRWCSIGRKISFKRSRRLASEHMIKDDYFKHHVGLCDKVRKAYYAI